MFDDVDFEVLLEKMKEVPRSEKLASLNQSLVEESRKPVPIKQRKRTYTVKPQESKTPEDPLITWKDKLRLVFMIGEPGSDCNVLAEKLSKKLGHHLITAKKAIRDLIQTEGLEKSVDLDEFGNVSMDPTLVFRAVKHSLRAVLDSHDVKLTGSTALCFVIEGFPCTLAQSQIFEANFAGAKFLIYLRVFRKIGKMKNDFGPSHTEGQTAKSRKKVDEFRMKQLKLEEERANNEISLERKRSQRYRRRVRHRADRTKSSCSARQLYPSPEL